MRLVCLLLALAPACLAAGPSPLFDGAPGREPPPAVSPPPPAAAVAAAEPVAADLAAAKARFGNEAMIAAVRARRPGDSFAFGVIGDAEKGRFPWERWFTPGLDAFERQWDALQARGPDFVLQLGDFVSEGTEANYRAHLAALASHLRAPLLRCVGNHDRSRPNGAADKRLYDAVFGPRDYYFDHGGWRFIGLDSSDRKVTAAQLDWLRGALAVPGPKVIFTHVPPAYIRRARPLAVAAPAPAGLAAEAARPEGYLHDFMTSYFEEGAEEFERLVEGGGVKAVFMGHIHAFWAADWRGVRYVISGGGGSPLYPLPPGFPTLRFAHTLWVEAGPDGLRETVLPLSGAAFALPGPVGQ